MSKNMKDSMWQNCVDTSYHFDILKFLAEQS